MSELADVLERFRRGAELVAMAITGAAGPEVDFRPAPDKWSVRQIVAHLADSECVAVLHFRRIIAEENPELPTYNQDAWAEHTDYAKRKPSQSLETFRRVRSENYELLKDLPEEIFQRTGNHPKRGPITLMDLLKIYAGHPEKHAVQIRNVRTEYKASKAKAAS